MEIIVTKHAILQYKAKMFSRLDDIEIAKILKTIVKKGKYCDKRPGNAYSMIYNGIKIVAIKEGNKITIITCLGNKQYSAWSQQNEIRPRYKKAAV